MNRLFGCLVVATILSPGVASAACSTATAAGNWHIETYSDTCNITITTAGGISGLCESSGRVGGSLTLSSACKLSGKIGAAAFVGRTEAIDPKSTLAPNLIIGSGSVIGQIFGYRR